MLFVVVSQKILDILLFVLRFSLKRFCQNHKMTTGNVKNKTIFMHASCVEDYVYLINKLFYKYTRGLE